MYKNKDGSFTYSPSDLIKYMESELITWLDRYDIEFPNVLSRDASSENEKLLQARGDAHECEFLAKLRQEKRDVLDLKLNAEREHEQNIEPTVGVAKSADSSFESVLQGMREGREVLYQAKLTDGVFAGFADFLVRVPGQSKFGNYMYEAWDTKLALSTKPYFLVQLSCYSELLAGVQGSLPKAMHIVLGDKTTQSFRTEDYFYFYRQLRQAFLAQQRSFDEMSPPDIFGTKDYRYWSTHVETLIKKNDHLCQVANIRATQIRKLQSANISTMGALANCAEVNVSRLNAETLATLRQQAKLQLNSLELHRPLFEVIQPQQIGYGLHLLPAASESDVFFDMEGYPYADGGLEYLFGATILENDVPQFVDWWAHDSAQEKQSFEDFIDWLYARWQSNPEMHVYHYAAYEKTALRKLMSRYGTREKQLDAMLRNEVFVDLFTVVRQSLRVGTPNYSIKSIEKLYREKREGEVATAVDSIVFYQRWLDEKDGVDWRSSAVLRQIRDYNQIDCESTWQLAEWLRTVQANEGIVFCPKEFQSEPASAQAQNRNESAELARQILQAISATPDPMSTDQRVKTLLAHLLEFHWRESKPVFWAQFERAEYTYEELFEDPSCLAGARRIGTRREKPRARSYFYDYTFDANQDTKLDVGNDCFYAHDLKQKIEVDEIDPAVGAITLRLNKSKAEPPGELSLILKEFVSADEIAKSILRTVKDFISTGNLPSALSDFLRREAPRLSGLPLSGSTNTEQSPNLERTIDVVRRMSKTALCIQGPPGSGKTYTAARAIAKLLTTGKRVGVTSNSHRAIANLLEKVASVARVENLSLRAVKLQSEDQDFHCESDLIEPLTPKEFFDGRKPDWNLVGGTAWAFSSESAAGLLDYLFVDEAGQVSVANLVGVSPSAKNLVVVGDQMQLSQPIKGTHPGESGLSVLEYALHGKQVVPDDFGVFLGTSWRMHPDVCTFISGAIYEDKLHSHPSAALRSLESSAKNRQFLKRSSGILYVPVEHEGNSQDSDEEAEVISSIVEELRYCSIVDRERRAFDLEKDLLIVAPYNMQVRKLRQRIGGVRVGSVDKFQGQEAAVAIISMCSSTGDSSPRGSEFIFSKNRLNVAISRAKLLAIVVGAPSLVRTECSRVEQMELVNLYCRIVNNE